jgi:RNA polymerase sigma-70 factor (ECF subfamily)
VPANEHYEIAAYEGLVTMAEAMGEMEVVELLTENLEQEKTALEKLKATAKRLAQNGANTELDGEVEVELARGAGRELQALDKLYAQHGSLARGMAFRVLRDRELAEDAVQEAFLDLWRTAGEFDAGRASVRTWICVLVHRRAVDIARREARRRLTDDGPEPLDPQSYTTEEVVLLRFEQDRVRDALAELSTPQRELVELAYYGGLTQAELAHRFDLPLGTVKSRMFAALRLLAVALA